MLLLDFSIIVMRSKYLKPGFFECTIMLICNNICICNNALSPTYRIQVKDLRIEFPVESCNFTGFYRKLQVFSYWIQVTGFYRIPITESQLVDFRHTVRVDSSYRVLQDSSYRILIMRL